MLRLFLYILYLLFLITSHTYSQALSEEKVDEYIRLANEDSKEAKNAIEKLFYHYKRNNKPQKAKSYAKLALSKSSDEPHSITHLIANRRLAILYQQEGKLDSSNIYVNNTLQITEGRDDFESIKMRAEAYNIMAGAHVFVDINYGKAYEYLRKGMDLAESIEYGQSYAGMGYQLCSLLHESESDRVPKMVDQIIEKIATFEHQPSGAVLLQVKKFKALYVAKNSIDPVERKEALSVLEELSELFRSKGRVYEQVTIQGNLASYFKDDIHKDSIFVYLENFYKITSKDEMLIANGPMSLDYAIALYREGRWKQSKSILNELEKVLEETKKNVSSSDTDSLPDPYFKLKAGVYGYLSRYHAGIGNKESTKKYIDLFAAAVSEEKEYDLKNSVSELEAKYELEKKESENARLSAENAIIKARFQYSTIIGILLLGLLAAGIYVFQNLRKNNNKLERINDGKNRLFAMVAHDLKGPAGAFTDLSETVSYLLKTNQTDRLMELSEYYENAGNKLNYTLSNLLDWAISQKDNFVQKPQNLDIKAEVDKIIGELEYNIAKKDLIIENNIAADKSMYFDKNGFKVILRNLLHNSIKFSHRNSSIIVDYGKEGLQVTDNGIGMKEETIKKILNKQLVTSQAGTDNEIGNGIGLSTCVKLAEQNDSKLFIESQVGKNTTITLIPPQAN